MAGKSKHPQEIALRLHQLENGLWTCQRLLIRGDRVSSRTDLCGPSHKSTALNVFDKHMAIDMIRKSGIESPADIVEPANE